MAWLVMVWRLVEPEMGAIFMPHYEAGVNGEKRSGADHGGESPAMQLRLCRRWRMLACRFEP